MISYHHHSKHTDMQLCTHSLTRLHHSLAPSSSSAGAASDAPFLAPPPSSSWAPPYIPRTYTYTTRNSRKLRLVQTPPSATPRMPRPRTFTRRKLMGTWRSSAAAAP
uniref:Uncharacterized protein n=1 Tax=Arundo donax TaxID=35708 RepID=A0A0A9GW80_ARUDO